MNIPTYTPRVRQRPMSNAKIHGGAIAAAFGANNANGMKDLGNALMNASGSILSMEKKRLAEKERERNKQEREAEAASKKAAREQEQINYYNQLNAWEASELNLNNSTPEDQEEAISEATQEITGSGFTAASEPIQVDKWQAMYHAGMKRVDQFVSQSGLTGSKQARLRHNLISGEISKIKSAQKAEATAQKKLLKQNAAQRVTTATDKLFGMRGLDFGSIDEGFAELKRSAFDKAETAGYEAGSDEFDSYCKAITSSALTSMCDELLQEGDYLKAEAMIKRYSPYLNNKEIEDTKDIIEAEKTVALALSSNQSESEVLANTAPELHKRIKAGFAEKRLQEKEDTKLAETMIDRAVINGETIPYQLDLGNGRIYNLSPEEIITARKQKIELAKRPVTPEAERLWISIQLMSNDEVAHRELTQNERDTLPAKYQIEYRKRKDKAFSEWQKDIEETIKFNSHKDRSDDFTDILEEFPETDRTTVVMDIMKKLSSAGKPADEANIIVDMKKRLVKHAVTIMHNKTWTVDRNTKYTEQNPEETVMTSAEFLKAKESGENVSYTETEDIRKSFIKEIETRNVDNNEYIWLEDIGAYGFKQDGIMWLAEPSHDGFIFKRK